MEIATHAVDAEAACEVLRDRSANCAWPIMATTRPIWRPARNKTPEIVAGRAIHPGNSLLVGVEGEALLAVGSVYDTGQITLSHVAPDASFGASASPALRAGSRGRRARQHPLHPDEHLETRIDYLS